MAFVKELFLHKKIRKKEDVSIDLTTDSLRQDGEMYEDSMKPCEGYKMTEKFDKVCS